MRALIYFILIFYSAIVFPQVVNSNFISDKNEYCRGETIQLTNNSTNSTYQYWSTSNYDLSSITGTTIESSYNQISNSFDLAIVNSVSEPLTSSNNLPGNTSTGVDVSNLNIINSANNTLENQTTPEPNVLLGIFGLGIFGAISKKRNN